MATTPEGAVKRSVRRVLDATGMYYFLPVSNGMGRMGVPDFIGVLNGRFIGIEAKAGKGKPTMLQLRALEAIENAGGLALVINENSLDYLKECLHDIQAARSNWRIYQVSLEDAFD